MRSAASIALLLAACSSSAGPADGGASPADALAPEPDAALHPDARPLYDAAIVVLHDGGGPLACAESCDCPQGLGCVEGECRTAGIGPVFCCSKPGCPAGELCLGPSDRPSRCPTLPDAGPDAGPRDVGTGVGAGCEVDDDCDTAQGLSCWDQFSPPYLWGGYCTLDGCAPACPAGSQCVNFTGGAPTQGCMASCLRDEDCRDDAYCLLIPGSTIRICYPDCRDDLFDCAPRDGTMFCSRDTGRCETSPGPTPGVRVGAPCADTTDCGPAQVCMSEIAWGTVGGMCTRVCSGLPEAGTCGAGETCQDFGGVGLCFPDCVGGACPARANALCTSLDPAWVVDSCVPL